MRIIFAVLLCLSSSAFAANEALLRWWLGELRKTPEALTDPAWEQESYDKMQPHGNGNRSPVYVPIAFSRTYLTALLESAFEAGVLTRRKISEVNTATQAEMDQCKADLIRNNKQNSDTCGNKFNLAYDDWEWASAADPSDYCQRCLPQIMALWLDIGQEEYEWLHQAPRWEGLHTFGAVADLIEARLIGGFAIQIVTELGPVEVR